MGRVAGNLFGGGDSSRKFFIAASFANAGIVAGSTEATNEGLIPTTTTAATDAMGLTLDTATYSATPAAGATGLITVADRPFSKCDFVMSGGATEGTALTIMTETAGDLVTPDLVSSTNAAANSMIGGTIWRYPGLGHTCALRQSRQITAHTASVSVGVTVDFEEAINVGDRFLMCPWTYLPGDGTDTSDGAGNIQFTTLFTQADASIASGTGLVVQIYDLLLMGESDSRVQFLLVNHPYFEVQA